MNNRNRPNAGQSQPAPPPPYQQHLQNNIPSNPPPYSPPSATNFNYQQSGLSSEICNWFKAVDSDGNGQITALELQTALMNSNWSHFNAETCRLMVGMFDVDRNGTIDIHEFSALWKYIIEWRNCFDKFDVDHSGTIDAGELLQAFKSFGFNLSMNFATLCVRVFDRYERRGIKLDDFIQCCVMLRCLSEKFKEKDLQKTGVIKIYYEEFLWMALDNTIV